MVELTWPQVLMVHLPDPHSKDVFLVKNYSYCRCENQTALLSITLTPHLYSKSMSQQT